MKAPSVEDVHNMVRLYNASGIVTHPVPREGDYKTPHKQWAKRNFDVREFGPDDNIGIRLGTEIDRGFLADVDLDLVGSAAVTIADEMLPPTDAVFGRASKPRSHRLYLTSEPVRTAKHSGLPDPRNGDKTTLIELRGLSAAGKSTCQTVVPLGIHMCGELIEWSNGDVRGIGRFGAEGLAERVRDTAAALAISQVWPTVGTRHEARLAFAKVLLENSLSAEHAASMLRAVARATGGDVGDAEAAVADTAHKIATGDDRATVGASWIAEHLGEEGKRILKVLDVIFGRARGRKVPSDAFDVYHVDLQSLTPMVWERVRAANDPAPSLFLQGGTPVRIAHIPEHAAEKKPTYIFQTAALDVMRHEVANVAKFYSGGKKEPKQIPPPDVVLRNMLATPPGATPLPAVTRIVCAPTVAPDGTIQTSPGYQPATGTYYVEAGLNVAPVPDQPTREEIARAVEMLREPIAEFPFVDDASRAHAIAFGLLPFVRDVIDGQTPLHLFQKSTAGEGASLLTDVLLYPSVGSDVARMSTVNDDDEWRKQITSTLMYGPSVVVIDNARELLSPQIAKVITDNVWQARILGVSRDAQLRVGCVWGATGINPTLHQEIVRRTVRIELHSGTEYPWTRTGFRIPNLRAWIREHRGEMVWAALTLARAWFAAGKPKGSRTLGMFEAWAETIGGILDVAGVPGFLTEMEEFYEAVDVEGDAIKWFVTEWANRHGYDAVRVGQLADWALADDSSVRLLMPPKANEQGARTAFSLFVRRLKGRVVAVNGNVRVRVEMVHQSGKSSATTWRTCPLDGNLGSVGSVRLPLSDRNF